jgi:hypothetical protein
VAFGNARNNQSNREENLFEKESILVVVVVVDLFVERTFDHHSYYSDKPVEVDIAWVVADIHLASMDTYSDDLLLLAVLMVHQGIEEYILPLEDLLVVFDKLHHKVLGLVRHTFLFLKSQPTKIS